MKLVIFVSRSLDRKSAFRRRFAQEEVTILGESLIDFRPRPFTVIPATDWIFFYSRRAVDFFFTQASQRGLTVGKETALAAIGPATAAALMHFGYDAHFVGDGNPESTARRFGKVAGGARVLFPRARNSNRSVQQMLTTMLEVHELIVYENEPRTDFRLPTEPNYVVLTSGLNARAFFHKYEAKGKVIFAIGRPTAEVIRFLTGCEAEMPDQPTEAQLAERVWRYYRQNQLGE